MKKLILTLAVLAVCAVGLIAYNNYKTNQKFKQTVEMNRKLDSLADVMYQFEDSIAENSFQ